MQYDLPKLHLLLHSASLVEERLRLRLTEVDISPRQARILDALSRMGQASQAELAREFDLTAASMSTMTVRLLEAGLISRTSHSDEARSYVLRLSDKGRSLLSEVRNAWADVDRLIESTIGRAKSEQLAALTQELRDALGGRAPGSRTELSGRQRRSPIGAAREAIEPAITLIK